MITIFLNGTWDFEEAKTKEAYRVAEAAMRTMFPKAYIFNPCEFLSQQKNSDDYIIKKAKLLDALFAGKFSHVLLLTDWWLWPSARRVIDNLAEGYAFNSIMDKPVIIPMTYEMEQQGKEYLSKLQKAEHQSKRLESE